MELQSLLKSAKVSPENINFAGKLTFVKDFLRQLRIA